MLDALVLPQIFREAVHFLVQDSSSIFSSDCFEPSSDMMWRSAKQNLGLLCSWLKLSSWSHANPVYVGRSTMGEMGGNSKRIVVFPLEIWIRVTASYSWLISLYKYLFCSCSFRFWVLWSWVLEYGFWPTKPASFQFCVRSCFFFIFLFFNWLWSGALCFSGLVWGWQCFLAGFVTWVTTWVYGKMNL